MKYKLIEITPEEYITLGEAGVWVYSERNPCEQNVCVCKSEHLYANWETDKYKWSKFEYRYTRIEQDADQDV